MNEAGSALKINGQERLRARAIAMEAGIRVASCYQCLRCTNSCPVSAFMDIKPHQVVRLTQLGQWERLLESSAIWICLSCEMCSTYCPNEVDVAGLMNHIKNSVVSSRRVPAEYEVAIFHEVFIDVLRRQGRINDLQLMQRFRWKTLAHGDIPSGEDTLNELTLALDLMKRKRLRLFPERSRAAAEIRRILKQYGQKGVAS